MPHSQPGQSISENGTPAARPGGVAVLVKALGLVDLLAQHGETAPARLAELLDEPRSTVYRLLATLQDLEFVEAGHARGTYRLGLKVFRLGATVVERLDARAAALPVMERLHDDTGETVFLCLRRDDQAVCIERIAGLRVALLELRLGGAMPLHQGAAPRALLAFEPQDTWDAYLDAAGVAEPARAAVAAELRATRERGYAISDQDVTPGIASVGAPIFGHTGEVLASVSIGGLREVVIGEDSPVLALVREAALEISHRLGYRR